MNVSFGYVSKETALCPLPYNFASCSLPNHWPRMNSVAVRIIPLARPDKLALIKHFATVITLRECISFVFWHVLSLAKWPQAFGSVDLLRYLVQSSAIPSLDNFRSTRIFLPPLLVTTFLGPCLVLTVGGLEDLKIEAPFSPSLSLCFLCDMSPSLRWSFCRNLAFRSVCNATALFPQCLTVSLVIRLGGAPCKQ